MMSSVWLIDLEVPLVSSLLWGSVVSVDLKLSRKKI